MLREEIVLHCKQRLPGRASSFLEMLFVLWAKGGAHFLGASSQARELLPTPSHCHVLSRVTLGQKKFPSDAPVGELSRVGYCALLAIKIIVRQRKSAHTPQTISGISGRLLSQDVTSTESPMRFDSNMTFQAWWSLVYSK